MNHLDPDPLTTFEDTEAFLRYLDTLKPAPEYRAGRDAAIEDCASAWRSGAVIVAGALLAVFVAGAVLGRRFR